MNPDQIPDSITALVYTAPTMPGVMAHFTTDTADCTVNLSQNAIAEQLAHYWPEIEKHIRQKIADQLITRAEVSANQLDDNTVLWASDTIRYGSP